MYSICGKRFSQEVCMRHLVADQPVSDIS